MPKRGFRLFSESVSTGVWCVPRFGAGFELALEPSELQKEGENPGKGHFDFLRQTLVCTKPWFKRDLISGCPQTGPWISSPKEPVFGGRVLREVLLPLDVLTSVEARGPGSLGGPGSWYSHGQTAHSSRKPRAGTPSRAGTPCPLPFPKRCRRGGGVPAGRGVPARRGVGVPARGILRPIRCQAAWEYHEPGPPNEPGPLAFSHLTSVNVLFQREKNLGHSDLEDFK